MFTRDVYGKGTGEGGGGFYYYYYYYYALLSPIARWLVQRVRKVGGGGGGRWVRKEEDWKYSEWSMEKVGDWGEN